MTKKMQSHRFSELTISRISDLIKWLPAESGTRAIEEAVAIIHTQLEMENEMSEKEKLQKALQQVWEPGEVNAGQVYKGFDFDGTIQAAGWWFAMFNGVKHFLGDSLAAARETIAQMVEEKQQQHQEWLDSQR